MNKRFLDVAAVVNMYNIRETAHCKVIGHLLELSEHRHNIIPMTIEKFTKSLNSSLEKKEKEKLPEDQKLLKKIARQTVSSVLKDLEAINAIAVSLGNIEINSNIFSGIKNEKAS